MKQYTTAILAGVCCILLAIAAVYGMSYTSDTSPEQSVILEPTPQEPGTPVEPAREPQTVTVTTSLGKRVTALGVTLEPLEVVEDSRCPSGVACIQAGTVRVKTRVISGLGTAIEVFQLQVPLTTEAEQITLVSVEPNTTAASAIEPENYRFTFSVETR